MNWISVHERMPQDNEQVTALINYVFEGKPICKEVIAAYKDGLWSGNQVKVAGPLVSHWQPLPAPPKEDK